VQNKAAVPANSGLTHNRPAREPSLPLRKQNLMSIALRGPSMFCLDGLNSNLLCKGASAGFSLHHMPNYLYNKHVNVHTLMERDWAICFSRFMADCLGDSDFCGPGGCYSRKKNRRGCSRACQG
jgi:hypothetical protein